MTNDIPHSDLSFLRHARADVISKPIAGQLGDLLQCARFLKEVRCTGNDLQFHFAAHSITRHLVKLDDDVVVAADYK